VPLLRLPWPKGIVIMSDDMGYFDIGCYGSEVATPNLDALAAGGLRYTQFYNTGRCCPTRASLLTGLYAHQAGIGQMTQDFGQKGYRGDLSRNAVTIAEVLKTAGYRTYMAGKWHVTKQLKPDGDKRNWPRQRGFDRFYGTIIGAGSLFDPWTLTGENRAITPDNDTHYQSEQYYYTDAISDNAVSFIAEHQKSAAKDPFFMYVSYTAAHWPMHALEKDIAKYKGKYDAGYEAIRKARYDRMKALGVIKDWQLSDAPQAWKDFLETDKAWELRCMEVYAAMIDNMDQGIGRIVKSLKDGGELENTLILFFQDNGGCSENRGRRPTKKPAEGVVPMGKDELQTEMVPRRSRDGHPVLTGPGVMPGPSPTYIAYGKNWANVSNTPFRQYKARVHEGGIATPMIAHWPKGIQARNGLHHQVGHLIDVMATCVDLAGATYPKAYQGHEIPPMEGTSLAASFAASDTVDRQLMWELYDMEADRSELNNVADKYPEKAKALGKLWEQEAQRTQIYPKPGQRKTKKK
jgi:arylsulfatase